METSVKRRRRSGSAFSSAESTWSEGSDDVSGAATVSSDGLDVAGEDEPGMEEHVVPDISETVSLFQCLMTIKDIFETAIAEDRVIVHRSQLIDLFEGDSCIREQKMLHDLNILQALSALRRACELDEVLLRKLHERSFGGERVRRGRVSDPGEEPAAPQPELIHPIEVEVFTIE